MLTDCPNDTNGDGDCGRQFCPYCGEGRPPIDQDGESIFFTESVGKMTPVEARRCANVLLHRANQIERGEAQRRVTPSV